MGEGKGGIFQENSIETCILSRVKLITSPGWMHETNARAWEDPEGSGGEDTVTLRLLDKMKLSGKTEPAREREGQSLRASLTI